MRRICYSVAASLDGYIAGPNGEYDWIVIDPEIDFDSLFHRFDTLLMGRRTFEMTQGQGGGGMPGMKVLVFSRTLRQADHPNITLVSEDIERVLTDLRATPGKDIWLFGGGLLFQSLLALQQVDVVEVAVIPVLLGGGVPLLPAPAKQTKLKLKNSRVYAKTGTVALEYDIQYPAGPKKARRAATAKTTRKPVIR